MSTALSRYVAALGLTACAVAVRALLGPVLGDNGPFVTFYVANVAAAHYLGLWPAVLAMVAGVPATAWFFIPPYHTFQVRTVADVVWITLYALTSGTAILIIEAHRKAHARADANAALAAERYQDLLRETAEKERAQQAEERQRRWAQVTLSSIGDAVICTDENGNVTFVNAVAQRLTGWTEAEAKGHPIDEVFDIVNEVTGEPADVPVGKVLTTGVPQGLANHTIVISRSGERTPIDDSAAPIRDVDGKVIGVVLVFRDITERKLREDELRRSNEDLKRFAYIASHDLQEPLRMVGSFVGLLKKRYAGQLDEDADRYIDFAVQGAKRMQALVQDLLAYSRAGTQKLALGRVALGEVLDEALLILRESLAETPVHFTRDELPVLEADRLKLAQVYQNLIGNAIKFRGEEPLQIHLGAEWRNGEWVLSVRDNGIGFEARHADRIFVMFQRLHGGAEYSGNGIGLAICKRIIEAHGGRIWAEGTPGQGSTFRFTLPGAAAQTTAEGKHA